MITFDASTKRIILDSASVTATELYSRAVDWNALNLNYETIFRQVGGDDLGSGLSIPPYYFLQNGWRIRPMEQNHTLVINGNIFVEEGGIPVVQTLGNYNVSIQYTVAVQAQGIATSGSTGPSALEIADAVRNAIAVELSRIDIAISTRANELTAQRALDSARLAVALSA